MQQWDEQMALRKKWETPDSFPEAGPGHFDWLLKNTVSAEVHLEELKKGANTGQGYPLSHFEPHAGDCSCEYCTDFETRRKVSADQVNRQMPLDDDDTDYFAKLAQNAVLNS